MEVAEEEGEVDVEQEDAGDGEGSREEGISTRTKRIREGCRLWSLLLLPGTLSESW